MRPHEVVALKTSSSLPITKQHQHYVDDYLMGERVNTASPFLFPTQKGHLSVQTVRQVVRSLDPDLTTAAIRREGLRRLVASAEDVGAAAGKVKMDKRWLGEYK